MEPAEELYLELNGTEELLLEVRRKRQGSKEPVNPAPVNQTERDLIGSRPVNPGIRGVLVDPVPEPANGSIRKALVAGQEGGSRQDRQELVPA